MRANTKGSVEWRRREYTVLEPLRCILSLRTTQPLLKPHSSRKDAIGSAESGGGEHEIKKNRAAVDVETKQTGEPSGGFRGSKGLRELFVIGCYWTRGDPITRKEVGRREEEKKKREATTR